MPGLFDILLANKFGGATAVQQLYDRENSADRLKQLREANVFGTGQSTPIIANTGGITPGTDIVPEVREGPVDAGIFGDDIESANAVEALFEAGDRTSVLAASQLLEQRVRQKSPAQQAILQTERLRQMELEQRIMQIPLQNALARSKADREIFRAQAMTESELRGEYTNDIVVRKAGQAFQAFSQLENLIRVGDPVAYQAAITAIAQIQEPGLAVRQDDRLAYSGQNPLIEQMVNAYNRALDGDITPETFERLRQSAVALMLPHMMQASIVEQDYARLAERKDADVQNVVTGVGFSPSAVMQEAMEFMSPEQKMQYLQLLEQ